MARSCKGLCYAVLGFIPPEKVCGLPLTPDLAGTACNVCFCEWNSGLENFGSTWFDNIQVIGPL